MNKKLLSGLLAIAVMTVFLICQRVEKTEFLEATNTGFWKKYPLNPVLPSGPKNAWNRFKTDPTIIKDGNVYKMWYGTNNGVRENNMLTKIAYATSPDGINWETYPDPVLLPAGDFDSWEGTDVETPTVIKDYDALPEERYKMWYSAWVEEKETYRIGYATSPDGINWKKYGGNPVLNLGNKETWDWDGWTVADPIVLKMNGIYHMWYSGAGIFPKEKTWYVGIGHATSKDGIHWTKDKKNPVMEHGPKGSFESRAAGQPSVVFDGSLYHMFYSGWDKIDKGCSSVIGYATSPDGIYWTKSQDNPILKKGKKGTWDTDQLVAATAIMEYGKIKLWYTGMKLKKILGITIDFDGVGIGYATAGKEILEILGGQIFIIDKCFENIIRQCF